MQEQTKPFRTVVIQLGATTYSVAPGSAISIPFAVINDTGQEDYFNIAVQGVPELWLLLDMPVLHLNPAERRESSVTIQSPGISPVSQGDYPVTIRATSQAAPEVSGEARFRLTITGNETTQAVDPHNTVPLAAEANTVVSTPSTSYDSGGQVGVMMETLQFTAAPGESLTIPIIVANREMVEDTYYLSVEGLPLDWISLPVAAVRLFPGEQRQVALTIMPPLSPASRAGRHPFRVRVVSQSDPTQVTNVDSVLTVKAVSQFTGELNPRHMDAGRTSRLQIHNRGNIQGTYTIQPQGQGDDLEFVPSQTGPVRVMPGETTAVDFAVSPRTPNWLGGPKTLPYTILVQSAEGDRQTYSGEIVSRSLIPIWVLPALLVFCLTAVCGLGFLWNWNQNRLTGATQTVQAQVAFLNAQTATAAVLQLTPSIPPLVSATVTPPVPSPTPQPSATAAPSETAAPSATPVTPTLTPITPTLTPVPPTATTAPSNTIAPTNTVPPTATFTVVPPTATSAPVVVATATLSPIPVTGRQLIVFASNQSGQPQLYLFDTSTRTSTRLTTDPGTDTQPAWSSDGSKIAFTSNRDGNNEIYVMNADGSNPVNLTKNGADDSAPAWSPDGSKIAFGTNRDGNNEIYVMNADGSNPINLTKSPASDSKPAWYTQGGLLTSTSRILFASDRDGHSQIYSMHTDGSSPTNLSKSQSNDTLPAVPFAGGQVAFVSDRDGNQEIYVMNLDGSSPTNLTTNPALDTMPVWSTDGKWIAFVSNRSGTNQVYIMSSGGKQVTNLSNNAADNQYPAWH